MKKLYRSLVGLFYAWLSERLERLSTRLDDWSEAAYCRSLDYDDSRKVYPVDPVAAEIYGRMALSMLVESARLEAMEKRAAWARLAGLPKTKGDTIKINRPAFIDNTFEGPTEKKP